MKLASSTEQYAFCYIIIAMLRALTQARLPTKQAVQNIAARSFTNESLTYFQKRNLPRNTIIKFVPQQEEWVIERMGRFSKILKPGPHILMPIIDSIRHVQTMKETAIQIDRQAAITADNVTLYLDGVLFVQVIDAYKASYGVQDALYAITQLAQTTMRSEIGKLTLQDVLRERQELNKRITQSINEAASAWGMRCLRHEIKDIKPPNDVLDAMHRQVSAERAKRAEILESEGHLQAAINTAEGERQMSVSRAEGLAKSISLISKAINDSPGGVEAMNLQVANRYVDAFKQLAREGTCVVIPAKLDDISGLVASGLSVFKQLDAKQKSIAADNGAKETNRIKSQEVK